MTLDTTKKASHGFTLIELSIVLVIIGLIVGGVLVGQDLIKAAELRAAVGQIEKYDAATNTFRTKYNGLPGDIASPANFGLTAEGIGGASDTGDNDAAIEASADDADQFDSEAAAFFRHMFQANLIQENITVTDFDTADIDSATGLLPASKLGRGVQVAVRSHSGTNYYFLIAQSGITNGAFTLTNGSALPVIDAYNIDSKMDDGNPSLGKVQAISDFVTVDAGAAGATADECVDTTGDNLYQISSTTYQADTECMLRIRGSF